MIEHGVLERAEYEAKNDGSSSSTRRAGLTSTSFFEFQLARSRATP